MKEIVRSPLALSTVALAVGIVVADQLFYKASVAVPPWLGVSLWGFCLLLCAVGVVIYRSRASLPFVQHSFQVLCIMFFATVGFAHYASEAADIQRAWQEPGAAPVVRGNPDEVDYRRWRWVQGVEADSTSFTARLRHRALRTRKYLIDTYTREGLEADALALVAAVTLGDRSRLDRSTRDLYAEAGASHLLALSGLHLGIIVGTLLTLIGQRYAERRRRWLLGALVLTFIWTFALVAGLPTSLVRASLMTSVFVVTLLIRHYGHPLQPLLLTAWLMLLLQPLYLFDVGAQLSFSAVAGILLLHRSWFHWARRKWRYQVFWLQRYNLMPPLQLLSVSIAAQLATLPLVAFYFHRIPLYGSLFNLLLIPLTTLLIYGALLLLLLGSFHALLPTLAALLPFSLTGWLARGLTWLVAAQLALLRFEVQLPGAVITDFWSRKAEPQVVVYHARRCPTLHVITSPSRSWLLTPQPDSVAEGLRSVSTTFWARRLTAPPTVLRNRKVIAVGDFQAVMVSGDELGFFGNSRLSRHSSQPMPLSLLWMTRGFRGTRLDALAASYRPRLLVLDASLPRWQRQALATEAARLNWPIYDVAEQGALRLELPE